MTAPFKFTSSALVQEQGMESHVLLALTLVRRSNCRLEFYPLQRLEPGPCRVLESCP
jgi:hypothetical protein